MKNHEYVDGELHQLNKKYAQLKLKQKERINEWFRESIQSFYETNGRYPEEKDSEAVVSPVLERIESAGIWIPDREIFKRYRKNGPQIIRKMKLQERTENNNKLLLEPLEHDFSVCKVPDYSRVDLTVPFTFTGCTDEENSLVCPSAFVPDNILEREDGWKGFRLAGVLDFSLIGILAGITKALANNEISVFAVSTFNTDYIFVKKGKFKDAILILKSYGFHVKEEE
jgi:hypothetical protein